jgi:hypothetical protein
MNDLVRSHTAAWRLGRSHFNYEGDPPKPVGLLIGEAPGPNTNARLPLFPEPTNSAAARLLKYADIEPAEWMGKLLRMNLCHNQWSDRRASAGAVQALSFVLDPNNYAGDGKLLRVLLLGRRVADAWHCGPEPFGYQIRHVTSGGHPNLYVTWIPHPSGRNLLYNERRNQLRARDAVLWATGARAKP